MTPGSFAARSGIEEVDVSPGAWEPEPRWEALTVHAKKRTLYSAETYVRETYRDACSVIGSEEGLLHLLGRTALLLLKPAFVVAGRIAQVLEYLQDHKLRPTAYRRLRLTRLAIYELWRYQMPKATLDRVELTVNRLTAADSLLLMLHDDLATQHLPASLRLAELKGPAPRQLRQHHQLRTALDDRPRIGFVHTADEPVDVLRELGVLFDRRQRRELFMEIRAGGRPCATPGIIEAFDAPQDARHDLDFGAALVRLHNRAVSTATSGRAECELLDDLLRRYSSGQPLPVLPLELLEELHLALGLGVEHDWDFICVAAELIDNVRPGVVLDVEPLQMEDLLASWRRR